MLVYTRSFDAPQGPHGAKYYRPPVTRDGGREGRRGREEERLVGREGKRGGVEGKDEGGGKSRF